MTGRGRCTRRAHRVGAAIAVPLTAFLLVACSGADGGAGGPASGTRAPGGPSAPGVVTVVAAASLRGPFEDLARQFDGASALDVSISYGSSTDLVRQIRDGAPAGVVATADAESMQALVDAGLLVGEPRPLARNRLRLVVKAGNPLGVRSLADLPRVPVVALCAADAPCGRYADRVLADHGVRLPADRVARGADARATAAAVATGDADAAIVYATDARGPGLEAVALDPEPDVEATYLVAVVAGAEDRAAAEAFVAEVVGPRGRAALTDAGFELP